jgi:hypothetical protein
VEEGGGGSEEGGGEEEGASFPSARRGGGGESESVSILVTLLRGRCVSILHTSSVFAPMYD